MRRLGLVAALLLASIAFAVAPAQAQTVDVESQTADNDFPRGVVFSLQASADAPVEEVRLIYHIMTPAGSRAIAEPDCSEGLVFQCSFALTSAGGSFLLPKVDIAYSWEIRDAEGNVTETEQQLLTYEDDRFGWRSQSAGNLTIWYYDASEDEVAGLLEAGRGALDEIGALLGATVDFPVKVLYYASAADLQLAIAPTTSPDPRVVTLGEVVYSDTAMISPDVAPQDILRHELSHVVMRAATEGPFGDPPAWLDEGTAVYAQSRRFSDQESALENAFNSNKVFSIRSLTSGTLARGSDVSLFYAQSYSIVAYVIDTFGQDDFRALIATMRDGATVDGALEQVYGFDQDGLEDAWREALGLPPREMAEPGGDGQSRPVPEITPFGSEEAERAPEAVDDGGGDSNTTAVVIVLMVTLVLAAAIGAGGFLVLRRR